MLARLPGHVWGRWLEYRALVGMGPLHGDLQFGTLAALVANVLRGRGDPLESPADFFPALKAWEQARGEEELRREQYRIGLAWAAIFQAQADQEARQGKGKA